MFARAACCVIQWQHVRISRRVQDLIATVPADVGAEFLAASENMAGPVGDVHLN